MPFPGHAPNGRAIAASTIVICVGADSRDVLFAVSDTGRLAGTRCCGRQSFSSCEGPYCLRHTFATEALAAGISTFELSTLMGSSIAMIERTYGHLARDSEQQIRTRLNARTRQMGAESGRQTAASRTVPNQ